MPNYCESADNGEGRHAWHACNALPLIACMIGADGIIRYVNAAWLRFAGENGISDFSVVSPGVSYLDVCRRAVQAGEESAREALEGLEAVLQGRIVEFSLEYPCHSPDKKRWFLMKAAPHEQGCFALIVHIDVTERKLADESLRNSEARLNLAIRQAGMGTWDLDLRTGNAFWSENLFRTLGYEPHPEGEANIGMWQARLHPEDVASALQEIENAKIGRNLFRSEHRVVRKDTGEVVWLCAFGRFLYDEDGEAVRFTGIFFDATERKRMEEAVRKTREELEARIRELRDKTKNLEEANTALRVIFKHSEEDRKDLEESIAGNLKKLILPYMEKLKQSSLNGTQLALIDTMEFHLNEITSSFSKNLALRHGDLTPAETRISFLIKDGKTTGEIAHILGLSMKTIETHRANIRKKLGLRGTRQNLRSHLLRLSERNWQ